MKKILIVAANLFAAVILSVLFVAKGTNVFATVPGNISIISMNSAGTGGGNGNSGSDYYSRISADGKYAMFESNASDLVASDTNAKKDVFVRNLAASTTQRVSVSSSGVQSDGINNSQYISETGRYVLFWSNATNLIDGQTLSVSYRGYVRDTVSGTTELAASSFGANLWTFEAISNDGRFVLLTSQSAAASNRVYIQDRVTSSATAIDVPVSGGNQNVAAGTGTMNCDGSFIVFSSTATNLTANDTNGYEDVFLADIRNGLRITNLTEAANNHSKLPAISCNGNFITFNSTSNNLVAGVTGSLNHVYRYDRINGGLSLVDKSTGGTVGNQDSATGWASGVGDDGHVVFASAATNLATGHNNKTQVYFRNTTANTTEILSVNSSLTAAVDHVSALVGTISKDSKKAIFTANDGSSLISGDSNGFRDVMLAETGL